MTEYLREITKLLEYNNDMFNIDQDELKNIEKCLLNMYVPEFVKTIIYAIKNQTNAVKYIQKQNKIKQFYDLSEGLSNHIMNDDKIKALNIVWKKGELDPDWFYELFKKGYEITYNRQ